MFAVCLLFSGVSGVTAQRTSKARVARLVDVDRTMSFERANAFTDGRGVWVSWQLNPYARALGFDVYRLTAEGRQLLNSQVIIGSMAERGFYFPEGQLGDTFEVECIRYDGTRFVSQRFGAESVPSLEEVSGRSADDLRTEAPVSGNIESFEPVLPQELRNEVTKSRQPWDMVNQRAVAVQVGVKIGIKKDGFYRVTKPELMAAGFDTAGDPTKWQLFAGGVEQAIIVEPAGNYIEFYARSINTIEADTRYYFLVNGATTGRRIGTRVSRPVSSPVIAKNYRNEFKLVQKKNYIYDILNGEADNFWGDIIVPSFPANITFNLSGIDTTQSKALMNVSFQGFSTTAHAVSVSLNGNVLGTVSGNSQTPFSSDLVVQTSALIEGLNTLTVSTSASGDNVLFDTLKIDFARRHLADQNRLAFYTTGYRRAVVNGFTSPNIRLFDITTDGEPIQVTNLSISQNGPTFDLNLPSARSRVFYALEDSAPLQAASIIPNYGSSLATPAHNANLIILSHGDFLTQAEAWANYRRSQGLTVEVVDVADVFDEFNFGTAGAAPITAFLSYAKDNWQTPPQYVLLIGDGSTDPKNYTNRGFQNLVPAKMVTTVYIETGSDEALADFNNDGLAELAVGRIPAKTPVEVSNALARVIAFENPAMQDLNRGALFAFDVPNGYDFEGMSHILADQLPAGMPKTFVNRGLGLPPPNQMQLDPMAQQNLVNGLNAGMGRYIVNYSGHGVTGAWVNGNFFSVNNFNGNVLNPQVTNPNLSVYTMLTCLNGYFVNPYNDSLSEVMFKHSTSGSVINWSSAGLTTPDVQLTMAQRFYSQLALGNMTRMGDLVRDAKTMIPGGSDVRLSWVVLGDPTLKVR